VHHLLLRGINLEEWAGSVKDIWMPGKKRRKNMEGLMGRRLV
jgi:hypothetical protein